MKKITLVLIVFLQVVVMDRMTAQVDYGVTSQAIQAYYNQMTANRLYLGNGFPSQNNIGAVIYYYTNEQRWGQLKVLSHGNNLLFDWATYNADGTLWRHGVNMRVDAGMSNDLDGGFDPNASHDFYWENIEGYLVPKNGAKFVRMFIEKVNNGNSNPPQVKGVPPVVVRTIKTNPKRFVPKGSTPNSSAYFQADFKRIRASAGEMGQFEELGGLEESPLHLQIGSILFYKTSKDAFGKMQIMGFGMGKDTLAECYIRWTTYKPDGSGILKAKEYEDLFTANPYDRIHDLDGSQSTGFDFRWDIRDDRLFIKARKDAKFYLFEGNETVNAVPESKQNNNVAAISKITWQSNFPATTNTPTLDLKACVETPETIKEYILVQNGQRSFTARGLIVQQANDCFNAFNKTVTLKTGENQFQLIAQSNAGELKSEVFTITYNPNATASNALSNPSKPQRRLALIIGNAAYPTAGLKNPVNDATDIAAALRAMGFEVISATNTNRLKMNTAIDDFGTRLKNYDLGFFYYAGHGLQVKGENYLVPIDAVPKSQGEVEYECYPVGKILAKMEEAANQANIIVLDACRDNPLQRSWSRSTGSNGLANINAPQGTFIGFATSPGSTAADGTGRNGVYTGALLEHIRKPNLTVDQLFNAVNGTVKKLTNNLQIPWKASSMSEDLYLTK